jgi:hypothetical protein
VSRPKLEVADIFRDNGAAWRSANAGHVSLDQLKVMSAIERYRTAALGGHVERCEKCSHTIIAYNSCRNRHCPKCQGAAPRDQNRYVMIVSTRSPSLNSGRLVLAVRPNMIWLEQILCAYDKLPLNRRSSGFEAIIATTLPRSTRPNLSAYRLALPSTPARSPLKSP